jgi:hypothetical protein
VVGLSLGTTMSSSSLVAGPCGSVAISCHLKIQASFNSSKKGRHFLAKRYYLVCSIVILVMTRSPGDGQSIAI